MTAPHRYILGTQRYGDNIFGNVTPIGAISRFLQRNRLRAGESEECRRRKVVLDWLVEQDIDHYFDVERLEVHEPSTYGFTTIDVVMVCLNNDDEAFFMKMRHTKQPLPDDFNFMDLYFYKFENARGCFI